MTTTRDAAPSRDTPPTIAQLAELAGVSVATVSKVVNGRSEVSAETRALIERLIREHGYRRQKRRANSSALLELVFDELEGAYEMEIIKGVEQVAREHRLAVVLSELRGGHTPGRSWIEDALTRRPTGVIAVFSGLTPEQRDRLHTRGVPLVLVDPTGDPGQGVPSVGAGNWSGGLSATRHLLELGHRRIAVITGPAHALSSRARLDGHRAAMDTAGVPVDPLLIREGDFRVAAGLAHARELLLLPDPPTAIFACNDWLAVGVYQAASELGWRIPDDLSVIGFDDLPPAQWVIPALTTVRQPLAEMAAAATGMVVALAQGEPLPGNRVELATDLVIRASTAPPKLSRKPS
ncbi:LacI family DNA-binding transcriptional regulator [Nonomuraea jiangxiensis]|uniref:LacI family transcriptional regulator, xylobiose transport system transcriptional regulator n=1 Tax=Nonomuraea jiangxiensis TaxID=633440 RepID=A0A1G7ZH56_9ACTN|nr:LacI family DNA-binding transcriptional regulator [Nonomuraea jiangxiensis]SDH07430.1 LacI family transcriptional regulator, xylobiose transport system transcriptional regulator [Nonomuraea jiangxiensis]